MTKSRYKAVLTALSSAMALLPSVSNGDVVEDFLGAIYGSSAKFDAVYRLETVEQDNALKDATGLNLRTRLGLQTGKFKGFDAFVEFEDIRDAGADSFNSTTNGKTDRSVILDPEDTEINQAFLKYTGIPKTTLIGGRQRIKLDNDRFVGNVGWRLNEQTYDGYLLQSVLIPKTTLTYGYLYNANRFFGDDSAVGDFDMSSHIANAAVKILPNLTAIGYAYLLDFKDAPFTATLSTQTYGIRVLGDIPLGETTKFLYTAEYATQSDYEDGSSAIDADYYFLEPGFLVAGLTGKVGYEVLEGNGAFGFSTPLATAHAFQGWADIFAARTPNNGIEDIYGSLAYTLFGFNLLAVYHDFSAENGDGDYGTELDLQVTRKFLRNFIAGLKYADYNADDSIIPGIAGTVVDTEKLWAWVGLAF